MNLRRRRKVPEWESQNGCRTKVQNTVIGRIAYNGASILFWDS
jgi:hypothetical protein